MQGSSTIIALCTSCWQGSAGKREARHPGQGPFPCWRRKMAHLQPHMMNSSVCGWRNLRPLKPVSRVAGPSCNRSTELKLRISEWLSQTLIQRPSQRSGKYKVSSPDWSETKCPGPTTCPRHSSKQEEKSWQNISPSSSPKQLLLLVNPCYGRVAHWSHCGKAKKHRIYQPHIEASSCPTIRPNFITSLSGNVW